MLALKLKQNALDLGMQGNVPVAVRLCIGHVNDARAIASAQVDLNLHQVDVTFLQSFLAPASMRALKCLPG